MRFRVTWLDRKRGYLIAEQLDDGKVEIGVGSRLGSVELRPVLGQPRALDDAGRPRTDLFVFHVLERQDIELVAVGDTVELFNAAEPSKPD